MRHTASLATLVAITLGASGLSAHAQDEPAAKSADKPAAGQSADPNRAASMTISAGGTAKVVAVDPAERLVILKTADGDMIPVKCGKNVANFDQIKAGDEVRATAVDRVAVYVGKNEEAGDRFGTGRVIMTAGKGERPGFLIADTVQAKAKVEAVDAAGRTVTLAGADGKSTPVTVGPDVDLAAIKAGDEITVRTTTGIALSVEKPGDAQLAAGSQGPKTRTATVEAVDRTQRTVTLKMDDGKTRIVNLGEEAVNFDQIEVGDQVRATVAEEVAVAIHRAGAEPRPGEAGSSRTMAGSPKGDKPGVLIAATRRVTGKIDSIDPAGKTVTLAASEGGKPQKMKVSDKVDLSGLKAGDEVAARVTDALAIVVEKPAKP